MKASSLLPMLDGRSNATASWSAPRGRGGGDWFASAEAMGETVCMGDTWPLASGELKGLHGPLGLSSLVLGDDGALRLFRVSQEQLLTENAATNFMCCAS